MSITFSSLRAANLPYRSITGPMQMSCVEGYLVRIEGKTSAITSTPFCFDHLPIKMKRSALGSTLSPAHSCACWRKPALWASKSSSTCDRVSAPDRMYSAVSVGSGLGSDPIRGKDQKIGYRCLVRSLYLSETPTAPNPS